MWYVKLQFSSSITLLTLIIKGIPLVQITKVLPGSSVQLESSGAAGDPLEGLLVMLSCSYAKTSKEV